MTSGTVPVSGISSSFDDRISQETLKINNFYRNLKVFLDREAFLWYNAKCPVMFGVSYEGVAQLVRVSA